MRFRCFGCTKSVSSEVDNDAVLRAILWCPECIEAGRDQEVQEPFKLKVALRSLREYVKTCPAVDGNPVLTRVNRQAVINTINQALEEE